MSLIKSLLPLFHYSINGKKGFYFVSVIRFCERKTFPFLTLSIQFHVSQQNSINYAWKAKPLFAANHNDWYLRVGKTLKLFIFGSHKSYSTSYTRPPIHLTLPQESQNLHPKSTHKNLTTNWADTKGKLSLGRNFCRLKNRKKTKCLMNQIKKLH
jgi:hypothetical protein